ncbi:acyltransferase [Ochrobactrum chromiisoli]|uniref:Acyltransferase n=1 Tax=Ochrobactrum chromiisoli TaxID=2993941 RepID=A0ABT3QP56_9HYPH|nr:hypothetical protein [Ochrobactrum chromiisoli]MCX2697392.1 hypothetical protein [Ochrobactrum chromiisoli]
MKRALCLLITLLIAVIPNPLKIVLLRAGGAKIGRGCYIGCSLVNVRRLHLGDYVRIGHFNLLHRLSELEMASGSKIESLNWITGAGKGWLRLGRNSSIRRFHFIEASGGVRIGNNTIIAGRSTIIYTHSADPLNITVTRSVEIGDWCYIGAACRFIPGSLVNNGTFVGMGSVVARQHKEEYVVLAGSPAAPRRELDRTSKYFAQPFKAHGHHPTNYEG